MHRQDHRRRQRSRPPPPTIHRPGFSSRAIVKPDTEIVYSKGDTASSLKSDLLSSRASSATPALHHHHATNWALIPGGKPAGNLDFRYSDRPLSAAEIKAFSKRRSNAQRVESRLVAVSYRHGERLGFTLKGWSTGLPQQESTRKFSVAIATLIPGGVATMRGAQVGDVIVRVNQLEVPMNSTVREVGSLIKREKRRTGGVFALTLRRGTAREALQKAVAAGNPLLHTPTVDPVYEVKATLTAAQREHARHVEEHDAEIYAAKQRIAELEAKVKLDAAASATEQYRQRELLRRESELASRTEAIRRATHDAALHDMAARHAAEASRIAAGAAPPPPSFDDASGHPLEYASRSVPSRAPPIPRTVAPLQKKQQLSLYERARNVVKKRNAAGAAPLAVAPPSIDTAAARATAHRVPGQENDPPAEEEEATMIPPTPPLHHDDPTRPGARGESRWAEVVPRVGAEEEDTARARTYRAILVRAKVEARREKRQRANAARKARLASPTLKPASSDETQASADEPRYSVYERARAAAVHRRENVSATAAAARSANAAARKVAAIANAAPQMTDRWVKAAPSSRPPRFVDALFELAAQKRTSNSAYRVPLGISIEHLEHAMFLASSGLRVLRDGVTCIIDEHAMRTGLCRDRIVSAAVGDVVRVTSGRKLGIGVVTSVRIDQGGSRSEETYVVETLPPESFDHEAFDRPVLGWAKRGWPATYSADRAADIALGLGDEWPTLAGKSLTLTLRAGDFSIYSEGVTLHFAPLMLGAAQLSTAEVLGQDSRWTTASVATHLVSASAQSSLCEAVAALRSFVDAAAEAESIGAAPPNEHGFAPRFWLSPLVDVLGEGGDVGGGPLCFALGEGFGGKPMQRCGIALIEPWRSDGLRFWAERGIASALLSDARTAVLLTHRARAHKVTGEELAMCLTSLETTVAGSPHAAALPLLRSWLQGVATKMATTMTPQRHDGALGTLLWDLGDEVAAEPLLRAALAASDASTSGIAGEASLQLTDALAELLESTHREAEARWMKSRRDTANAAAARDAAHAMTYSTKRRVPPRTVLGEPHPWWSFREAKRGEVDAVRVLRDGDRAAKKETKAQLIAEIEAENLEIANAVALRDATRREDPAGDFALERGRALIAEGLGREAANVLHETFAMRELKDGYVAVSTLDAAVALSEAYESYGMLQSSYPLRRRVHDARVARLGAKAPATVTAGRALAHVLVLQGRGGDAAPLLRAALDATRESSARHHAIATSRAITAHEKRDGRAISVALISALVKAGNLAEAEQVARNNLEATERAVGLVHSETAAAVSSVADVCAAILAKRGTVMESAERQHYAIDTVSLCRRVLDVRCGALGRMHSDTLASASALADAIEAQVRHGAGEAAAKTITPLRGWAQAGSITEATFDAAPNPAALHAAARYATALAADGALVAAASYARTTRKTARATLGPTHAATLAASDALRDVLTKLRGSEIELSRLVAEEHAVRQRVFGVSDPTTQQYEPQDSIVLPVASRLREAGRRIPLLRQALAKSDGRRTRGPMHPESIACARQLLGAIEQLRLEESQLEGEVLEHLEHLALPLRARLDRAVLIADAVRSDPARIRDSRSMEDVAAASAPTTTPIEGPALLSWREQARSTVRGSKLPPTQEASTLSPVSAGRTAPHLPAHSALALENLLDRWMRGEQPGAGGALHPPRAVVERVTMHVVNALAAALDGLGSTGGSAALPSHEHIVTYGHGRGVDLACIFNERTHSATVRVVDIEKHCLSSQRFGLRKGDRLLSLDGHVLAEWHAWRKLHGHHHATEFIAISEALEAFAVCGRRDVDDKTRNVGLRTSGLALCVAIKELLVDPQVPVACEFERATVLEVKEFDAALHSASLLTLHDAVAYRFSEDAQASGLISIGGVHCIRRVVELASTDVGPLGIVVGTTIIRECGRILLEVKDVMVGSTLEMLGVKPNDWITTVDGVDVDVMATADKAGDAELDLGAIEAVRSMINALGEQQHGNRSSGASVLLHELGSADAMLAEYDVNGDGTLELDELYPLINGPLLSRVVPLFSQRPLAITFTRRLQPDPLPPGDCKLGEIPCVRRNIQLSRYDPVGIAIGTVIVADAGRVMVEVASVAPGSVAFELGIVAHDWIESVNGISVDVVGLGDANGDGVFDVNELEVVRDAIIALGRGRKGGAFAALVPSAAAMLTTYDDDNSGALDIEEVEALVAGPLMSRIYALLTMRPLAITFIRRRGPPPDDIEPEYAEAHPDGMCTLNGHRFIRRNVRVAAAGSLGGALAVEAFADCRKVLVSINKMDPNGLLAQHGVREGDLLEAVDTINLDIFSVLDGCFPAGASVGSDVRFTVDHLTELIPRLVHVARASLGRDAKMLIRDVLGTIQEYDEDNDGLLDIAEMYNCVHKPLLQIAVGLIGMRPLDISFLRPLPPDAEDTIVALGTQRCSLHEMVIAKPGSLGVQLGVRTLPELRKVMVAVTAIAKGSVVGKEGVQVGDMLVMLNSVNLDIIGAIDEARSGHTGGGINMDDLAVVHDTIAAIALTNDTYPLGDPKVLMEKYDVDNSGSLELVELYDIVAGPLLSRVVSQLGKRPLQLSFVRPITASGEKVLLDSARIDYALLDSLATVTAAPVTDPVLVATVRERLPAPGTAPRGAEAFLSCILREIPASQAMHVATTATLIAHHAASGRLALALALGDRAIGALAERLEEIDDAAAMARLVEARTAAPITAARALRMRSHRAGAHAAYGVAIAELEQHGASPLVVATEAADNAELLGDVHGALALRVHAWSASILHPGIAETGGALAWTDALARAPREVIRTLLRIDPNTVRLGKSLAELRLSIGVPFNWSPALAELRGALADPNTALLEAERCQNAFKQLGRELEVLERRTLAGHAEGSARMCARSWRVAILSRPGSTTSQRSERRTYLKLLRRDVVRYGDRWEIDASSKLRTPFHRMPPALCDLLCAKVALPALAPWRLAELQESRSESEIAAANRAALDAVEAVMSGKVELATQTAQHASAAARTATTKAFASVASARARNDVECAAQRRASALAPVTESMVQRAAKRTAGVQPDCEDQYASPAAQRRMRRRRSSRATLARALGGGGGASVAALAAARTAEGSRRVEEQMRSVAQRARFVAVATSAAGESPAAERRLRRRSSTASVRAAAATTSAMVATRGRDSVLQGAAAVSAARRAAGSARAAATRASSVAAAAVLAIPACDAASERTQRARKRRERRAMRKVARRELNRAQRREGDRSALRAAVSAELRAREAVYGVRFEQ